MNYIYSAIYSFFYSLIHLFFDSDNNKRVHEIQSSTIYLHQHKEHNTQNLNSFSPKHFSKTQYIIIKIALDFTPTEFIHISVDRNFSIYLLDRIIKQYTLIYLVCAMIQI